MEVWPSEFDVTEARRLEGTIHRNALERGKDGLAWLAHTIGVGICTDWSTEIFVLRGYVVIAEDREVTLAYRKAVKQRLTGERQRLVEEIRAAAASALGMLGGPEAMAALRRAKGNGGRLGQACREALARLGE